MFGFENITANNGWAMAVVGASIVFVGLVILSFVISQIHVILNLWERKDEFLNRNKKQTQTEEPKTIKAPVSIQAPSSVRKRACQHLQAFGRATQTAL